MGDLSKWMTMALGGAGVLIATYLILTNPQGDSAASNALGNNLAVPVVKSLQGR